MSTIQLGQQLTHPSAPSTGKVKIYTLGNTAFYMLDDGVPRTFGTNFGTQFFYNKTTGLQTTGNTVLEYSSLQPSSPTGYNEKLNIAAKYKIEMDYLWGHSSASNDFRGFLFIDGVQFGDEHRQEPKDGGGDQQEPGRLVDILEPGDFLSTSIFSFRFRSSGGNTARVFRNLIQITRIE